MTATTSRRARRLAGLAGLLGTAVLLVAGKAATAPPPMKLALGTPQPSPTPVPPSRAASSTPAAASPTPAPPSRAASSASAAASPSSAPSPAGRTGTFLGRPEDVGYGIVQVRLTLTDGRITDVRAVQLPSGGRSSEITAFAGPRLRTEVLAAQSANIDAVSGASFTSEGYAKSVQSVLDAAPR